MPSLEILELAVVGHRDTYSYPFRQGVNLLVGPVGTGKTSLLEVLKWCLGGAAILSQAVQDGVNEASVTIRTGETAWTFSRSLRSQPNRISVFPNENPGDVERLVAADSGPDSAGQRLMQLLGIPETRIPRSRARPGADTTPITFWDVYEFMYVAQRHIDAAVLHSNEPYREPKRKATFELLYGIATEEMRELQRRLGELNDGMANARSEIAHVGSFLERSSFPDQHSLRVREQEMLAQLQIADGALSQLKAGVRAQTPQAQAMRGELAQWRHTALHTEEQLNQRIGETRRRASVKSQLYLDLERLERTTAADLALHGLEFRICPRCWQVVEPHRYGDGRCYLCSQQEPEHVAPAASLERERRRLEAQIAETDQLISQDERSIDELTNTLASAEAEIARLTAAIDEQTAQFVSPLFGQISDSSARVAKLREQVGVVQRGLRTWDRFRELESELGRLETEARSTRARLEEAQAATREGRSRFTDLSEMFVDTLRQLAPPHFDPATDPAHLDQRSYLPIVGGRTFYEELSSGIRTVINDAYHLGALRYAAGGGWTLLPTFLILDSPRKNFGSLPEDRALSERLYRLLHAMQAGLIGSFQLLVADNDTPPVAAGLPTTSFSYESAFVKDLEHPGPDDVEPLE